MSYPYNFNYYEPAGDALAPARRAGIMMYVCAGVFLLSAFCCIGVGAALPTMMQQYPEVSQMMRNVPEATPRMIQISLVVMGGLTVLLAILTAVLGWFVGRGSQIATILSIVLACLVVLVLLLNAVQAALVPGQSPQNRVGALCMMTVPLALTGLLIVFLIAAARAAPRLAQSRQFQAQQYWQYYQQQQGYGAGPYAPPVGMPPSMQAPPPPSPPPQGDSNPSPPAG